MKTWKLVLLLSVWMGLGAAQAAVSDDEGSFMTYDEIVNDLNQSRAKSTREPAKDPFDQVKIHAGVGLVSSYLNLSPEGKASKSSGVQGVEASFGIDLLDPEWMAEGAIRSFGSQDFAESRDQVELREFDLRVVYRPNLSRLLQMRVAGGIASRYLSYITTAGTKEYSTPAMIGIVGVQAKVTSAFSFGAEVGYRSRMTEDTIDNSSLEGTLRTDFHF